MAWFGRRRDEPPAAALTAAGERINLADRAAISRVSKLGTQWQKAAWDYAEEIGELGKALRVRANIISKVQFLPAQVQPDDDEPILFDSEHCTLDGRIKRAAEDVLRRLPFENGFGFQGIMSTCFDLAGECWLWGRTRVIGGKPREEWTALSTEEVRITGDSMAISMGPSEPLEPVRPEDILIRLWVPHPRYKRMAYSPMISLLDVCSDVVLTAREMRAQAQSRISRNGLLLVSRNMAMGVATTNEDGITEVSASDTRAFQNEFTAAVTAPILDPGHPGAVAPLMLIGEPDDLEKVKHITFAREDSPTLISKLEKSLERLADSLDFPSDMLKGVKDANHWTGWLLDSAKFKDYIEPGVRLLADSLTNAYFRESLMLPASAGGPGLTYDEAQQVRVWYDAGNVTENANRAADAKDAWDRGLISAKRARSDMGYNDSDEPDEEDLRKLIAVKTGADQQSIQQVLAALLGIEVAKQPPREVITVPSQVGDGDRPAAPGQAPSAPTPTGPRGIAAAAAPQPGLRVITNGPLADIDNALIDKLTVAADDAILRALEKAGNRIKGAAQRDKALAASLRDLDATEVGAFLGRDRLAELGQAEENLLAGAFDGLRKRFDAWTTAAIKSVVRRLASMLGLSLTDTQNLVRSMTGRVPGAWAKFQDRLMDRARAKLYGTGGDELRGEVPDSIVHPADIREALAEIGGGTAPGREDIGGIGLGADAVETIREHAGPEIGVMWVYGTEPRNTFEPHRALDDRRFDSAADPRLATGPAYAWCGPYFHPGDHRGCRCHLETAWIFPENTTTMPPDLRQALAAVVSDPTQAMRDIEALAAADDAAGRTGTTAQQQRDQRARILRLRDEWLGAA